MMRYIVDVSGGMASAVAMLLTIDRHGSEPVLARFADTKSEDQDLYRFLADLERVSGKQIIRLVDGRTIWDVFSSEKMFTNPQTGGCLAAWKLKKQMLRSHLDEIGADPRDTTILIGFDQSEQDRMRRIEKSGAPWKFDYPLTWGRPMFHCDLADYLRQRGIEPPDIYDRGYEHNNCGGACIQAGIGQWAMLLRDFPERFEVAEKCERDAMEAMRVDDRPVQSILRDRRGGETANLPLSQLRREVSQGIRRNGDEFRRSACSCMGDLF